MWRQRLQLLWFLAVFGYWSATVIVQDIHDVLIALLMLAFFAFVHWVGKVILCLLTGGVWVPLIATPKQKQLPLDTVVKAGKPKQSKTGSGGYPIEPYNSPWDITGREN